MSIRITEKDCTKIATKEIAESFIRKKCAYFSGEVADSDRLRPDKVIVHLFDYRKKVNKYNVCIHTVESKVHHRYFIRRGNAYSEGVSQARNYYGNYCWLAVSNYVELLGEEDEKLISDCKRAGVGLIICRKTRADIVIKPYFDDNIYLYKYPRYARIIAKLQMM